MTPVPHGPDAIDLGWLGGLLGGRIDGVLIEAIDDRRGLNGETYRMHLDGAGVPASIVAKFPGEASRGVARFQRWYEREVRFYRELAARTPLRSPRCFHAEIDDDDNFILLLEDLGQTPQGNQVDGCDLDEAYRVVRSLAAMHARWWDSSALEWLPYTTVGLNRAGPVQSAFGRSWSRVRDLVATEAHPIVDAAVERYVDLLELIATSPVTLCHGDLRLDNLFLPPSPPDVIAFDWQFACRARGTYDIAYFLALDLDHTLLAEHEDALIAAYVAALAEGGVGGYTPAMARDDYATALLLSLAVFAIGAAAPQPSDAARVTHEVGLDRLGQAIARIWKDRSPGL